MMRWLAVSLICCGAAYAQVPTPTCNTPATVRMTTAGSGTIVANRGDQTILLCSITVQITQGATASDYQLQACTDATCASAYAVTPVLPGHASLYDTYNLPANPTAQIVLRKGYGLYLTLTGTAIGVAQVIYGAY